ncbi:hypothetical protein ACS5PU_20115 [Pedobacter sp. GSP4]|uniref:hypothetical protein n=1 Tax=Pedobacter sp. GSP4 TaxID=3453716 RepID=UPI003EECF8F6
MPVHLTPGLDILDAIQRIDFFLKEMNIVPVLEYRKIRYKLSICNVPFMTIALAANHITSEKLSQLENDERLSAAYYKIESFVHSFSNANAAVNLGHLPT